MAREYDHLFKLLIIGDSGKEIVPGVFTAHTARVVSRRGQWSIRAWSSVRERRRDERLRSVQFVLMNLLVDQHAVR